MAKKVIKNSIWVESVFATIFIYSFIFLISNIPAFRLFDEFDVINQALKDLEMTDISFSAIREAPTPDEHIVLVNIGKLSRADIARQLQILDKYHPKVIGIDSFFEGYANDTAGTASLANALNKSNASIIMAAKVDKSTRFAQLYQGEELYDRIYLSHPMLTQNVEFGMVNLDTEAAFQQDVKTCRKFPPVRKIYGTDDQYLAFGAKLAEKMDTTVVSKLLQRHNEFETINFRGDFINFFDKDTIGFRRYYALDYDDVLDENFDADFVKDKIIILGYLGENFQDLYSWEDKFFTPLNKRFAGRTTPDMYGAVIHANITSMILDQDYVYAFNQWADVILGIILCYANVLLFSYIYKKMGVWYDGITKLIQVVEVIFIIGFIVLVFANHSIKLELTLGLIAVALAGDLLEVYYGVINNTIYRIKARFRKKRPL